MMLKCVLLIDEYTMSLVPHAPTLVLPHCISSEVKTA